MTASMTGIIAPRISVCIDIPRRFFMHKFTLLTLTVVLAAATPALAQNPPAPSTATATSSAPGKGAIATLTKITATVVAIDKTTREVTLKGPKGGTMTVEAGPEVRNFDQIKVGDHVVAQYAQALSLELMKKDAKGAPQVKEKQEAVRAKPGEQPGAAVGRQVTAIATVVAVDEKKKVISLRGPKGNVVDLQVQNPDHFKVVKKGDKVEAVYTEAVAISVEPAPKKQAKK
jgi:hypothetical protein